MPFEEVLYDVADRVATVTLNRPAKLNAWTPTMEAEVHQALAEAEKDDGVRVIVLTGAGRAFCAGADMKNLDFLAGLLEGTDPSARLHARLAPAPGSCCVRITAA